jgi:UDP-glucose 4-epimerase
VAAVTFYDNFSSGREWHYEQHLSDPRFCAVRGDVRDIEPLTAAMRGNDVVIHLASNPDIARAATEPDIDLREGTYLTNNVVEAMRTSGTKTILYASGSGVYGDLGEEEAAEDYGPLLPISTYGASKLAGEVLITSYCHMFEFTGRVFRFGNVVGPRMGSGSTSCDNYITVTGIAQLAVECAGLEPEQVEFEYTGGNRGWKATCPSSA